MKLHSLDNKEEPTPGEIRLSLGEAWMYCSDCNAKLYSFDGVKDTCRKCPHPKECEDEDSWRMRG